MNDRHELAVLLDCSDDPLQPCCIFLPHQTPLGTHDNQLHPPIGTWNAMFLCLAHEQACPRSERNVGLEPYMLDQREPIPPFWQIEYECGRENCGMPHTIYTGGPSDFSKIVSRILRTSPAVPCGDHNVVWKKELMQGTFRAHLLAQGFQIGECSHAKSSPDLRFDVIPLAPF